jgi:hypothetical protein
MIYEESAYAPASPRMAYLLIFSMFGACLPAHAEPATETAAVKPAPADGTVRIKLGNSAVDLNGPWKFHVGDNMGWAKTDFDDSGWDKMDVAATTDGNVPGWTARGYPDYSGYAWYRLRVDVESAGHRLALKMPDLVDDAYQVYVNGQMVGQFGRFSRQGVTAFIAQPVAIVLPKSLRTGPMTIAIRTWMDSATRFSSPDAGGLHGPPVLGYSSEIASQVQLDWNDIAHGIGSAFLEMLILAMALVMALALFWLDRDEKAYLWLAMVCTATLLGNFVVILVNFTTWIGQTSALILSDVVFAPLRIALWVLFWASWFRFGRMKQLQEIVGVLFVLLMAGRLC